MRVIAKRPLKAIAVALSGTLLLAVAGAAPAYAKKKKEAPPPAAGAEKKDKDNPFKDWDETLKDSETMKGFFTFHRKYDTVWMELAPDQLDKPVLMISSLSSGLGKGWLLGGMPLDNDLWTFHRAGNKVQVVVKNTRFKAVDGSPMAQAVSLSYADSVLAATKIVSINKDSKNVLIELNDVLLSDLPGIGIALKQTMQ